MRTIIGLILPAVATAATLAQDRSVSFQDGQNGPIKKIANLLKDMSDQTEKDFEEDQDDHDKMVCWCDSSEKEKKKAIEFNSARVEMLTSVRDEVTVKLAELTADESSGAADLKAKIDAAKQAAALAKKEGEAAAALVKELEKAYYGAKQALTALKTGTSLQQVKEAATLLQTSKALSLATAGAVEEKKAEMLKVFVANASPSSAVAFLSTERTAQRGAPIGTIIAILEGMSADFKTDLDQARTDKEESEKKYLALKATQLEGRGEAQAQFERLVKEIAAAKEHLAHAKRELVDTKATLEKDREFLLMVEKRCPEAMREFEQREEDVKQELKGLQETIEILESESSQDLIGSSKDFMQISQTSARRHSHCQEAASLLKNVSRQVGSPKLILLALSLQGDSSMEKVMQEIDKMLERGTKQLADEGKKKDWCVEELAQNKRKTNQAYHLQERLKTEQDTIEENIKEAEDEVKATKEAIKQMEIELQKAGKNREKEQKDYQQNVMDQRMARGVLKKAKDRLKRLYSFVQKQAPPKKMKEYRKNQNGKTALVMIETVIEDTEKSEKDAEKEENQAQNAYAELVVETKKGIKQYEKSVLGQQQTLAKEKESLLDNKQKLAQNMDQLEAHSSELQELSSSCSQLINHFDHIKASREEEISGLRKAKGILSAA